MANRVWTFPMVAYEFLQVLARDLERRGARVGCEGRVGRFREISVYAGCRKEDMYLSMDDFARKIVAPAVERIGLAVALERGGEHPMRPFQIAVEVVKLRGAGEYLVTDGDSGLALTLHRIMGGGVTVSFRWAPIEVWE